MITARDNVWDEDVSLLSPGECTDEALYGLLRKLQEAGQPNAIAELLGDLARMLRSRYAGEEGAGGLFAELEEARPANCSSLRSLRSEHREIWHSLEGRRSQVRERDRALSGIREDVRTLATWIREHEGREFGLIMETYAGDEGGLG